MTRIAIPIAALISIASCFGETSSGGSPVRDVYHSAAGGQPDTLRVLSERSPLSREMPVPVITPPEIFPVFVPTHVDPERDMMIGEHFLFIKLRDSAWLSEKELDGDPVPTGVASDLELRLLKEHVPSTVWERAFVPYRAPSKP